MDGDSIHNSFRPLDESRRGLKNVHGIQMSRSRPKSESIGLRFQQRTTKFELSTVCSQLTVLQAHEQLGDYLSLEAWPNTGTGRFKFIRVVVTVIASSRERVLLPIKVLGLFPLQIHLVVRIRVFA